MKRTISAILAFTLLGTLLGSTAAMAAPGPFHPEHRAPERHVIVERHDRGHEWRRGERFSGRSVVVGDWRHYHLRTPPRGYHWVRSGDDFFLVAVTSGVIADILLHGR